MLERKLTGHRLIRIGISVILIILVLFANLFAVKAMGVYGRQFIVYEKLSVAYNVGGMEGLRSELANILAHSKLKGELKTVGEFSDKLDSLKDPRAFLKSALSKERNRIFLFNKLRHFALILIIGLLVARIILNVIIKRREKLQ